MVAKPHTRSFKLSCQSNLCYDLYQLPFGHSGQKSTSSAVLQIAALANAKDAEQALASVLLATASVLQRKWMCGLLVTLGCGTHSATRTNTMPCSYKSLQAKSAEVLPCHRQDETTGRSVHWTKLHPNRKARTSSAPVLEEPAREPNLPFGRLLGTQQACVFHCDCLDDVWFSRAGLTSDLCHRTSHLSPPTALFEVNELVNLCRHLMHEGLEFGEPGLLIGTEPHQDINAGMAIFIGSASTPRPGTLWCKIAAARRALLEKPREAPAALMPPVTIPERDFGAVQSAILHASHTQMAALTRTPLAGIKASSSTEFLTAWAILGTWTCTCVWPTPDYARWPQACCPVNRALIAATLEVGPGVASSKAHSVRWQP